MFSAEPIAQRESLCYYPAMKTTRLALISLQNTFIDFGIRYIASAAKQQGYHVDVLWMGLNSSQPESGSKALVNWLKENEIDLVGIGLMSIHYSRAVAYTHAIRNEMKIPVIWGGIHPILSPEKCLETADYVCTGDGEFSVLALMEALEKGIEDPEIENIWFKSGESITKNKRTVVSDLDQYPPPDYDLEHHHVFTQNSIVPGTVEMFSREMPWSHNRHYVITSRGCPYQCTYCSNSALKSIFGKTHSARIRSVESVIGEIRAIKQAYPFVQAFAIMDDSFFFKPKGWIETFCQEFKTIDAGFGVLMHPKTVTRDRLNMLLDAGLIGIQMGLQSGSERTSKEIYHRPEPVSEFVRAAGVLDEFMDRLVVRTYDVIVDNPLETDDDRAETVRILSHLNKPFHLDLFSLTLFPGTELYDMMRAEGKLLSNDLTAEDKNYLDVKPTMLNRLAWMTHTTSGQLIRFFLRHRHHRWCRLLFRVYDNAWEQGLRVMLRKVKRSLLSFAAKRIGLHDGQSKIVRGE